MSQGVQQLTVTEEEVGQRLDNYLIRILKGAPKSLIYRIIRKGEVRINKGRAKPDRKLAAGDVVRVPPVRVTEPTETPNPGKGLRHAIESAIIYESKELLVVNKPSGLAVHGGSGISLGLIESLRAMYGDSVYLELVHRLDRDTSGCVMVAKKRSMLRYLQNLLVTQHGIDKRYLALVAGHWSKRKTLINAPLRKNELQSGERVVRVSEEGKPSKTEFRLVERYDDYTLVEAKPITGRTHQIRVHAQHAGHPLIGDDKYGDEETNKLMKRKGVKRLFLHAASLRVKMPDDTTLLIEAPLPNDLATALKGLRSTT